MPKWAGRCLRRRHRELWSLRLTAQQGGTFVSWCCKLAVGRGNAPSNCRHITCMPPGQMSNAILTSQTPPAVYQSWCHENPLAVPCGTRGDQQPLYPALPRAPLSGHRQQERQHQRPGCLQSQAPPAHHTGQLAMCQASGSGGEGEFPPPLGQAQIEPCNGEFAAHHGQRPGLGRKNI